MTKKLLCTIILSCACTTHTYKNFGPFFNDLFFNPAAKYLRSAMNISENETSFVVQIEVPGYAKEDINIQVNQNGHVVTVTGKRQEITSEINEQNKFSRKEIGNQQFSYSETFGRPVTEEGATAELKHGILTIVLPKIEKTISSTIQITD